MRKMFRVTYAIATQESAEYGDNAETGFVLPGEWKDPIEEALKPGNDYDMTLREARDLVWPVFDSGRWFDGESRQDYATGDYEERSLHPPPNITPSSYHRLRRLFQIRGA